MPPVRFIRVLFLYPPGVGGIESLKSFSSGKVRELEELLPFPLNDLSFAPRVACRTGILNFNWVIDPMENLMKALDFFPEKS